MGCRRAADYTLVSSRISGRCDFDGSKMKLLIFGAGVLGTFYAAKLSACGQDVTVFARGHRAAQIRADGLVVKEFGGSCLRARVSVIETLEPEVFFDFILALVRNEQIESVLPLLAMNKATASIVFMFNNLDGPGRLIDALGGKRVVLGFPGAAGKQDHDGNVEATILPTLIQKTTIGELDGSITPRIRVIAKTLTDAGFPTAISTQMDAWLKTHVALVSPIADAFYDAGSDLKVLANSRSRLIAMVHAVRQAFSALRAQGTAITPAKLRGLALLPDWLLVGASQLALRTAYADLVVARHATVARDEMAGLSEALHRLVARSPGTMAEHDPATPEKSS